MRNHGNAVGVGVGVGTPHRVIAQRQLKASILAVLLLVGGAAAVASTASRAVRDQARAVPPARIVATTARIVPSIGLQAGL